MKLDRLEENLIAELETDSRQSLATLAKKFHISPPNLRYKLHTLSDRRILNGFYTIIDFFKLGYSLYRLMIRFSNIPKEKYGSLITYLMQHSNVQYLVECGGKWDLMANFMAKNIVQFNAYVKELQEVFPQEILDYNILAVVNVVYLARDYLINSIRRTKITYWFTREYELVNLDNINLQILDLISEDARITYSDMAKKLKVTPHTVIRRMSALKKEGFIMGFKPLLDLTNTQYSCYKALVTLRYHSTQKINEIINYIKSDVYVTNIIELIGPWDFEIEFEVDSRERELELTRNLQERFSDIIKEFDVIPLFRELRHNFFPRNLTHN